MAKIARVEITDTFGGEANYCWVRRYEFFCEEMKDREIMKKIKHLAGWTGIKVEREDYGDTWTIRPRKLCQICFVDFEELIKHEQDEK